MIWSLLVQISALFLLSKPVCSYGQAMKATLAIVAQGLETKKLMYYIMKEWQAIDWWLYANS